MAGSNDQHKRNLLRGALFEYLDEGMIDELIEDAREVLKEEELKLSRQVDSFKKARRMICGDDY